MNVFSFVRLQFVFFWKVKRINENTLKNFLNQNVTYQKRNIERNQICIKKSDTELNLEFVSQQIDWRKLLCDPFICFWNKKKVWSLSGNDIISKNPMQSRSCSTCCHNLPSVDKKSTVDTAKICATHGVSDSFLLDRFPNTKMVTQFE